MAKSKAVAVAMSEDERSQAELWDSAHPGRKMPGTFEPEEGNCSAKMRNRDLDSLGIIRYCGKSSGYGTSHPGVDRCKFHGGSTPTQVRGAMRKTVRKELALLSQDLEEADPIGPPELEAFKLAAKVKRWSLIIEEKMDELDGMWTQFDQTGVERVRAMIELMERAHERLQRSLEFLLKHDLHKRVVALEEQQALLISQAFFNIIMSQEMDLKEKQVNLARRMFSEAMIDLGDSLSPSWAANVVDGEVVD